MSQDIGIRENLPDTDSNAISVISINSDSSVNYVDGASDNTDSQLDYNYDSEPNPTLWSESSEESLPSLIVRPSTPEQQLDRQILDSIRAARNSGTDNINSDSESENFLQPCNSTNTVQPLFQAGRDLPLVVRQQTRIHQQLSPMVENHFSAVNLKH